MFKLKQAHEGFGASLSPIDIARVELRSLGLL